MPNTTKSPASATGWHTSGPWKVNKYGGIGTGERGCDIILVDSTGIADGADADYLLMAAAPDLLEALKTVKGYFADLENGTRDDDQHLKALRIMAHAKFHRVIDAAIAKATTAPEAKR